MKEATAAVDTAKAQVNDAQAYFDRANLDYERARILFSTQSMTKPDYDAAKAQHEIAQAKLEASRGQLKSAEARIAISRAQIGAAESKIKTAEASTFSSHHSASGHATTSTHVRCRDRSQDRNRLAGFTGCHWVCAGRPDFRQGGVWRSRSGAARPETRRHAQVTTDALPGTEFSGHISRISPSADQNSRVFDVEVTISNPDGRLKPGMIASLSVNEGAGNEVECAGVPLTAITRSKENPNAYAVLVVEEREGKQFARLRTVTLGESLGNAVVVTSGVRQGEMVVTMGATQVAMVKRCKLFLEELVFDLCSLIFDLSRTLFLIFQSGLGTEFKDLSPKSKTNTNKYRRKSQVWRTSCPTEKVTKKSSGPSTTRRGSLLRSDTSVGYC